MKNTFISKADLAQAYFPYIETHSAVNKMMQFINNDSVLLEQLYATGYKMLARSFSPLQVQMIFDRLGNPFG